MQLLMRFESKLDRTHKLFQNVTRIWLPFPSNSRHQFFNKRYNFVCSDRTIWIKYIKYKVHSWLQSSLYSMHQFGNISHKFIDYNIASHKHQAKKFSHRLFRLYHIKYWYKYVYTLDLWSNYWQNVIVSAH